MGRATTKGAFVAERLIEARDARDVTQKDLAKAIGRSESTISHWEHGLSAPDHGALSALARCLGLSTGYFLRPVPDHGNSPIFFRSLANAAARARSKERAKMRWLQHISLTLQETLDFPEVDVPLAVSAPDFLKLKNDDLEQIAIELRRHWDLGEGPIPSMGLVAENAGVVVGIDEVGSTKIDGQGTWSDADNRPYILLARDKYTAFRRQMDIAHELAHLIAHRWVDKSQLEEHFDLIEQQAKYLAGAILLPAKSFLAEIQSLSLDGFLGLKSRWMVAVGAMIMRAEQLEVLSEHAAKQLWKYRAIKGWHRREPLDSPDETPVEEPRLLRRSIEMIVMANARSKRELLDQDFGLGGSDVEMLASLPAGFFAEHSAQVIRLEPKFKANDETDRAGEVVPFTTAR